MPKPRFTICELLLLITLTATALGWFVDHRLIWGRSETAYRARAMEEALKSEGWIVESRGRWHISIHTPGHREYEWGPAYPRGESRAEGLGERLK